MTELEQKDETLEEKLQESEGEMAFCEGYLPDCDITSFDVTDEDLVDFYGLEEAKKYIHEWNTCKIGDNYPKFVTDKEFFLYLFQYRCPNTFENWEHRKDELWGRGDWREDINSI